MHFDLGNKTSYTEGYQTIGSTWTPACSKIDKMGVVCIGLVGVLQNNYGDHWVTAYQYYLNNNNKGFFKCIDNVGKSNAIIHASWTWGG